jgi:hypothetical protein
MTGLEAIGLKKILGHTPDANVRRAALKPVLCHAVGGGRVIFCYGAASARGESKQERNFADNGFRLSMRFLVVGRKRDRWLPD